MQDMQALEERLDRVFRVMCSKLEAPMDSGQASLSRITEEMQLNVPTKPFTVARTEQGTVILNLMYKADKILSSLLAIEDALIKRKDATLKRANKPSWRRRSMMIQAAPEVVSRRAGSYTQLPDLTASSSGVHVVGAHHKEVSMAEANRMAQMSIRKHMGHDMSESDEGLLIGPSDTDQMTHSGEEAEAMGRTKMVVNYTRHGLAAIDEQKRVGMLKLEQTYADSVNPQGMSLRAVSARRGARCGANLEPRLGRDYFWDTECMCKAKKVPKRASAMVVLVAKSPRRRYYVGDSIPVEFEIRNHTMKVIKEVAMSLCHVTYGAVMGYSPDDKEKKQRTKLRVEKAKEAVRTEVMAPMGFPIRGKFRSTHHVRFKVPFSAKPSVVFPDVLPDNREYTETVYMIQIRVGGPKLGGPILSLGPLKLEPRPSMQ